MLDKQTYKEKYPKGKQTVVNTRHSPCGVPLYQVNTKKESGWIISKPVHRYEINETLKQQRLELNKK